MKLKRLISFATLIFVLTVAGVRWAHAQSSEVEEANLPFDFYAGVSRMSAGAYYFALDLENKTVTISDNAGQHRIFLIKIPTNDGGDKYALVFVHSGDSYFLKDSTKGGV
jgi:hypothetical protein